MSKGNVTVRPMEDRDVPAVLALDNKSVDAWKFRELQTWRRHNQSKCTVAERDGSVVGFVVLFKANHGRLHIQKLTTAENGADAEAAAALTDWAQQEVESQGCFMLTLEVRKSNERAIDFFSSQGFRREGVAAGFFPDGEDAEAMEYRPGDELDLSAILGDKE